MAELHRGTGAAQDAIVLAAVVAYVFIVVTGWLLGFVRSATDVVYICFARDLDNRAVTRPDVHAVLKDVPAATGAVVVQPDNDMVCPTPAPPLHRPRPCPGRPNDVLPHPQLDGRLLLRLSPRMPPHHTPASRMASAAHHIGSPHTGARIYRETQHGPRTTWRMGCARSSRRSESAHIRRAGCGVCGGVRPYPFQRRSRSRQGRAWG